MRPSRLGGLPPDVEPLADVVERLFDAFRCHFDAGAVVSTVRSCCRDLDISSAPALPELVERLARERMQSLLELRSASGEGLPPPS
jgi:hypothetical protein